MDFIREKLLRLSQFKTRR